MKQQEEAEWIAENVLPHLHGKGQKGRFLEMYPRTAAVLGWKRTRRILETLDYELLEREMELVKRETKIDVMLFSGLVQELRLFGPLPPDKAGSTSAGVGSNEHTLNLRLNKNEAGLYRTLRKILRRVQHGITVERREK